VPGCAQKPFGGAACPAFVKNVAALGGLILPAPKIIAHEFWSVFFFAEVKGEVWLPKRVASPLKMRHRLWLREDDCVTLGEAGRSDSETEL